MRPRRTSRAGLRESLAPATSGDGLVAAAPPVALRAMLRRFWPYVRPFRFGIVALLAFSVAAPAVETGEIWLFKNVVDKVLLPRDVSALYSISGLFIALALGAGLIGWIDSYLAAWIGEHVQLRVRAAMLTRLQGAGAAGLQQLRAGDVLTRLSSDVAAVEGLLISVGVSLVGSVATLVFFGAALLRLDWQLTLASLAVVPVFWFTGQRFARRLKALSRETRRRTGSMTAAAAEQLAVLELVTIHGREAAEAARFEVEARSVLAAELGAARLSATFPLIVDLAELFGVLAVMGAGTWALSHGQLTIGGLLVFLTLLSQLYKPVKALGALGNTVAAALAGLERIAQVLDLPPALTERPDPVVLEGAALTGELVLDGAGFSYPGARRPVLSGASARFRPGQLTVLRGPSGSGKSTLIRLLSRLTDPTSGAVLLDGVDLRELSVPWLRRTVTVLPQEAPVLDAGVRENVLFGRAEADDSAVWAALRAAGAEEFVAALPEGLDTRLGPEGRTLSGGQRQRIALARALATGARVLILDEPTTGLDKPTADRLLDTLRTLVPGRTVIVATHDPAVLAQADTVVTLHPATAAAPRRTPAPHLSQQPLAGVGVPR